MFSVFFLIAFVFKLNQIQFVLEMLVLSRTRICIYSGKLENDMWDFIFDATIFLFRASKFLSRAVKHCRAINIRPSVVPHL